MQTSASDGDIELKPGTPLFVKYGKDPYGWNDRSAPKVVSWDEYKYGAEIPDEGDKYRYVGLVWSDQATVHPPKETRVIVQVAGAVAAKQFDARDKPKQKRKPLILGAIRKWLIDQDLIETIIGLPNQMFFNTKLRN